MKTSNLIVEKSYQFALRILKTSDFLSKQKQEYVLSKQLLRCGTSVGANIEEAIGAQSRADFIAKLSIAFKEARETHYWLRLLKDGEKLPPKLADSLIADIYEIRNILAKILLTTKSTPQKS